MSYVYKAIVKVFPRNTGFLQTPGFMGTTALQNGVLGFTGTTSTMNESGGMTFTHVP